MGCEMFGADDKFSRIVQTERSLDLGRVRLD